MESLKQVNYSNYDIYLVDNDSEEKSINSIKNYLELSDYYSYDIIKQQNLQNYSKPSNLNLLFILNNNNSGFAGGNNVALEYISKNNLSDYVLLLNNDTIVSGDFIRGLLDKVKESDDIGFVGIKHYYYNMDKIQTIGGGMIDLVHGEVMAITEDKHLDNFDFITGSCILMPLKVLADVGTMCPDFFMYWEDVDWSTSVREYGYKLKISDYGCIYHKEGASIKSLSRIYYHTRNRIFYMKRHTYGLNYYKFIIYIILFVLKESVTNIKKDNEYSKTLFKGLKDGLFNH